MLEWRESACLKKSTEYRNRHYGGNFLVCATQNNDEQMEKIRPCHMCKFL